MGEIIEAGKRLAIYARVSTEEQKEGQTIDSQIAELERFARDKCWQITGIYKDEGWSGGVMARPELDRMRDDARNGLFEAVLINDVDRLARDVTHLGVIKRDLEKHTVRVIFRKLPSDTSPASNLMVNILGSFAEFERELISDRTRRGRRHKVEVRKQYLGSNTAYGYRYIPKDQAAGKEGILEIMPEEAAVVRSIFLWVDQEGLSARQVVRRLNELKIRPKKGACQWAKSSVLRILRNEMYAGVWHYNKFEACEPKTQTGVLRYRKRSKCSVRARPRSEWLPLMLPESLQIIPRIRWERVQCQIDRNIMFSPRNEKHAYLLKSLVVCGGCKSRYVGEPCHGNFYYRCHARCKRFPTIRASALDDAVKEAITETMLNPGVILDPLRKLDAADAIDTKKQEIQIKAMESELQQIQKEEDRLLEAYRQSIISPAQLGSQIEKLKSRKTAADMTHSQIQPQKHVRSADQIQKDVIDYCSEAAERIKAFTPDKWREFLRTVIRTIIFEGTQIRIKGEILSSSHSIIREESVAYGGRIATMRVGHCGPNPGGEYRNGHSTMLDRTHSFPHSFEVRTPILRSLKSKQIRNELGRFSLNH
jgi:site-specific DNA recombinase